MTANRANPALAAVVTPQETAEKIRDMLRALGCPASCGGSGECVGGSWYVSAGEGTFEEPVFTVYATGVACCALRFAPVGSLRARRTAPFDEAVIHRRCTEIAALTLKRAERNAANAKAWAVADELRALGMIAIAQEDRVVLTFSFSPEYAREMGPRVAAVLGERKAET